jgi:CHAD domain-containing protein
VRIARGRIDDAAEQLSGHARDRAAAVHEARKDLKKLRSLLRLARPALGSKLYRRENGRFRDLGRALSDARDAEVKLQTLGALRNAGVAADGIDEYKQALARERAAAEATEETLDEAIAELESARDALDEWDLNGWRPTGKGLRRAYRRGRKALAAVRAEPSDAAVHEWRKRSKDLWYHLRLLRDGRPEVLAPAADRAHELSDLIGDHHDLAVLAEDVKARRDEMSPTPAGACSPDSAPAARGSGRGPTAWQQALRRKPEGVHQPTQGLLERPRRLGPAGDRNGLESRANA